MLTKSSSALNNASLLAAAGIDARLLSQMAGSGSLASLTPKRSTESPVQKPKEDTQTQQQRQAAAKLALRKQLEKTLLQVNSVESLSTNISKYFIFRSHHPSHLHQKCISSPTLPTQSSFT